MNETTSLKLDKAYYEANWKTLMKFKGKQRRRRIFIAIWFAVLLIVMLSTGYPLQDPMFILLAFYLFLIIYGLLIAKQRWVKAQMKSKIAGQEIKAIFTDEYLEIISSMSEGKANWSFFTAIFEDKESFILEQDGKLELYFPKSAFANDEAYQRVLNKLYHEI